jgi:hypothetical protein
MGLVNLKWNAISQQSVEHLHRDFKARAARKYG